MKTLQRSSANDWYIFDEDHTTIAHTSPSFRFKQLSLANIEAKIREWDYYEMEQSHPYATGSPEHNLWHEGFYCAKSHYKVTLPDTYEVETKIEGDFMVVTKVMRAV